MSASVLLPDAPAFRLHARARPDLGAVPAARLHQRPRVVGASTGRGRHRLPASRQLFLGPRRWSGRASPDESTEHPGLAAALASDRPPVQSHLSAGLREPRPELLLVDLPE